MMKWPLVWRIELEEAELQIAELRSRVDALRRVLAAKDAEIVRLNDIDVSTLRGSQIRVEGLAVDACEED